ncbi:DUF4190 domain-containing protein [Promicromonospora iranensis]|uniref:DUF4190 domain-containing protein n=1 Tax=Promicromonospora iranensis TaxID=1105144 RepID=A0ABU2CVN0_9MICO|nr:DUF4190 domain-containing protein [Promicromonospora iranensis]MDR7385398.1 hypothetical protein [Promicromonospora iranensis]
MTQSDGWKSPYDPPQQDAPGPVPDPAPAAPVPDQGAVPPPYGQPYPDLQQPAPQQPSPQPYQQGPYQPYQQPYQQGPAYQPGQPQPAPYGAPYGYAASPEKNALGVWSLVLGILSVVMLFSCFVGFLAAIPAVITGHLSRKAQKEGLADNAGLALGGIITGWVTIGLTALVVIVVAILFSIPEFREGFFSDSSTYSDY